MNVKSVTRQQDKNFSRQLNNKSMMPIVVL
jgi:hypothetical protein